MISACAFTRCLKPFAAVQLFFSLLRLNRCTNGKPPLQSRITEKSTARPARDVLPPLEHQEAVKRQRGQRGPQKAPVKKSVTLRLDPDILTHFKAMGEGWQRRMNEVLRRSMERP